VVDRNFRPGRRDGQSPYGNRQLSEDRYAWVRTFLGQFVILLDTSAEDGDLNVTIYHPREKRAAVALGLTELTTEELDAMQELFNKAFELARPTTRRRDEIADEAFQRGDDRYARSYREPPQLVYRQRTLDKHSEGVQQRPAPVPAVTWGGLPSDFGELRESSDEVAEQHEGGSQSQDDGTAAD